MNAIICDIDGTLADCEHRRHLIQAKDWKGFYDLMHLDTVKPAVKTILKRFYSDHKIVLCSGRPDNYRSVTEKWLRDNDVSWHILLMRKEGDNRADYIVKEELLQSITHAYDVAFVIDDRKQVVDMWRRNGLLCFQCDEGNF